jgi:hypothetical protein
MTNIITTLIKQQWEVGRDLFLKLRERIVTGSHFNHPPNLLLEIYCGTCQVASHLHVQLDVLVFGNKSICLNQVLFLVEIINKETL